jgi:hypothetical protein
VTRLNYGLAIDHAGNYQVIDTSNSPGIRDDYSPYLAEPFIYYVAPHNHIDQLFKIDHLSGAPYNHMRSMMLKFQSAQLRDAILAWHGVKEKNKKPTW